MAEHLSKMDDKVNRIYDKMFKENILISTKTPATAEMIHSKMELVEEQMNNIETKVNNLVEMISDKLPNGHKTSKDDPKHLNVNSIVEAMNDGMITTFNSVYEAIDDMNRNIQQNKNILMQNFGELMMIREHLNINNKINDSSTVFIQQQKQQQRLQNERKERGTDHSMLINEILRMVRNRLRGDNNENRNSTVEKIPVSVDSQRRSLNVDDDDDDANNSSTTFSTNHSPIKDDDFKSTTELSEKAITRKDGLIFPNIKNKPSKINTTFTTDSLNYRDVKVSNLIN